MQEFFLTQKSKKMQRRKDIPNAFQKLIFEMRSV